MPPRGDEGLPRLRLVPARLRLPPRRFQRRARRAFRHPGLPVRFRVPPYRGPLRAGRQTQRDERYFRLRTSTGWTYTNPPTRSTDDLYDPAIPGVHDERPVPVCHSPDPSASSPDAHLNNAPISRAISNPKLQSYKLLLCKLPVRRPRLGQQARCTARRRKLGAALREIRERAGVTVAQAAEAAGGGNSKVSRIETGKHRVSPLELNALLDLYGVTEKGTRDWLHALVSEQRKNTWWRQYGELAPGFVESLTLENEAEEICVYQIQSVPGLLQTPDYARVVLAGAPEPRTEETLDLYVDIRMKRQNVLRRQKPPQYRCVMTEGVIRQQIGGPQAMAAQLRHLVSMSRLPNVTIQVISHSQTTFTATAESFVLHSYPPPMNFGVVQIPYLDRDLFLEEDGDVAKYQRAFDALRASALSAQRSSELISSIAHELEQE
ncbi:helix-turn-helix domain-containing protein [Streptomyces klenkii]|uniref:helix-turn-helix domain-containing protein n=1 Tax=Streptomyces klenkii TaxID=1420899 RepID=UPI00342DB5B3